MPANPDLNIKVALEDIEEKLDELVESLMPEEVARGDGITPDAERRIIAIMGLVRELVQEPETPHPPISGRRPD